MMKEIYRAVIPKPIREIIYKIRTFPTEIRDFRKEYTERKIIYSFTLLFTDWMFCRAVLGASPDDYFKYMFYNKAWRCRREFITWRRMMYLFDAFNGGSEDERILLEDKTIFAEAFRDYTKRKIMSSGNLSEESFRAFLHELGRVIIKPADGYNGNGIYILSESDGGEAIRRAYDTFAHHKYTVEEVLTQDGMMREINPGTLNTMRVNVINNNGSLEIQNAVLRTGQGNRPVDNISAGGLLSKIDIETGIIVSMFCDKMNKRLLRHPLTGAIIIGRKIPLWEKVKETAIEAAGKISRVKYTSWDIAVISGGDIAIVEGNTYGNFGNQQLIDQVGLWSHYRKYLQ